MNRDYPKELASTLVLLIAMTVPFWVAPIDINIQSFFYSAAHGWRFDVLPIVKIFYKYGTLPGMILAGFYIVILGLGFLKDKFRNRRKEAMIILLTLLLGPALMVNVFFKSYSGRPRPRDVAEFNGKWKYQKVFEFGTAGKGHSFPSGHASMGFLFCALFFALRDKNKNAAKLFFFGGLGYGTIMGIGRMVQGAHFASDVIWAGGLTILAAQLSEYLVERIRVLKEFSEGVKSRKEKVPALIPVTVSIVLAAALIFFFLIATPFYREYKDEIKVNAKKIELSVNLMEGDIIVRPSARNMLSVDFAANGFAMPGRIYEKIFEAKEEGGVLKVDFMTFKKGIFSEVNATLILYLPAGKEYGALFTTVDGNVKLLLTEKMPRLLVYTGSGRVEVEAGQGSFIDNVYIKSRRGSVRLALDKGAELGMNSQFDLFSTKEMEIINNTQQLKGLMMSAQKINGAKELIYRGNKPEIIRINAKAGKIKISGQ